MSTQTPYDSYRHAAETMDSSAQVRMLYDAAISYVTQSKVAIQNNDHDARFTLIEKSMAVMRGLRACLDFSNCEEIAAAMDQYYEALDKLMVSVQCNPDENLCNTIIENLRTIKTTWEDIKLSPTSDKGDDSCPPEKIFGSNLVI